MCQQLCLYIFFVVTVAAAAATAVAGAVVGLILFALNRIFVFHKLKADLSQRLTKENVTNGDA